MHAMCSASYALKKQSRQLLTETDDVLAYSVRWMLTGFQPAFNNQINRLLRARIPLLIRHFIRRTPRTPQSTARLDTKPYKLLQLHFLHTNKTAIFSVLHLTAAILTRTHTWLSSFPVNCQFANMK